MPGLEHEHAIARRERVDERRLPGAGARGGIDHDRRPGLEHGLEPFEDLQSHGAELGAAMIHRGAVDRAQNPVGHVGGPGDLQEMASAPVGHDLLAYRGRTASLSEKLPASMIWLKAAVSWSTRGSKEIPWRSASTSSPTWSAPGALSASAGWKPLSRCTGRASPRPRRLRSPTIPSS